MSRSNPNSVVCILFVVMSIVCAVAACSDDDSGQSNNNNNATDIPDGGIDDGSVGSDGEADAWTFDCPTSQPDGHVCLRGVIRSLSDDQAVPASGGLVRRYVAQTDDEFPGTPGGEAQVGSEGRFVFRSVRNALILDSGGIPAVSYEQFDLELEATVAGFLLPTNKYGVLTWESDRHIVNLYVIPESAINGWTTAWQSVATSTPGCQSVDFEPGTAFKTVFAATYDYWSTPDPDFPNIFPKVGFLAGAINDTTSHEYCALNFTLARTDFQVNSSSGNAADRSGLTVISIPTAPSLDSELIFVYPMDDQLAILREEPKYGMLGTANVDRSGDVVVVHSLID